MAHHLFLASTPFNTVIASMIALDLPSDDTCELWLIDQPSECSIFVKGVLAWPDSPFRDIRIATYQARSVQQKKQRKRILRQLSQQAKSSGVTDLYTGNDRRIEFQWLMAHLPSTVKGHYIDDGTYSYIGRNTRWFSDGIVDNLLKKLTYGFWWKQPETIGASDWIQMAHLAFPEHAVPQLQKKVILQIPDHLSNPAFTSLGADYSDTLSEAAKLDALIILPHESVRSVTIEQRLLQEGSKYERCGIKRHPRSESGLPGDTTHITEISARVPFELLLSGLKPECCVIGDVSSALLTARWLRPRLQVICLAEQSNSLTDLMRKIGIEVSIV
ncbi:hypothetical protein [uncultured Thalassolituus sp.]|uniref:hypothetical protein n=1 Tax=uncultured Thalassolituus sp. TaxID=285273 RepID=UPI00262144E6|nr:hypothetical protein [uncultured Thalassolituus sp.]